MPQNKNYMNFTSILKKITVLVAVSLMISPLKSQIFKAPKIDNPVKWVTSFKVIGDDEAELIMQATIDEKWHLYGQYFGKGGPMPTVFTFESSTNFKKIGKVSESPKPYEEIDEDFGIKVQFFKKSATFTQKIKLLTDKPFNLKVDFRGQACLEMCIPIEETFEFSLPGAKKLSTEAVVVGSEQKDLSQNINDIVDTEQTNVVEKKIEKPVSEAQQKESNNSMWTFFIIALLTGIAGALTPCVYPMIPMTVTFFMNSSTNKAKAKSQALFYGFSIIFIYTFLGVIFALIFGPGAIKSVADHYITNIIFFLLFLLFAASFFGMFEIVMPSWLTNKSDKQVDRGGFIGSFFMAMTLVLVSTSCTAPFVGGLLIEAASGDLMKPVVGMLGFSIAFATPFTILAFFPSLLAKMPKSGGWLNSVKVVLGFIIIALGLKFLIGPNDVLNWGISRDIFIAIWIVLFTLMGFYLLGKIKFAHDSPVDSLSVPRLLLVIAVFTFVVYMIPGLFGAKLSGLSGLLPSQTQQEFDLVDVIKKNKGSGSVADIPSNICETPKFSDKFKLYNGLNGYFDYKQGMACAKQLNKPVFIDFTGHYCANCKKMQGTTLADEDILKLLRNEFVIIELYTDDDNQLPENEWYTSKTDGKLKKTIGQQNADLLRTKFGQLGTPYYIILDTDGNMLTNPSAYEPDISKFKTFLNSGLSAFVSKP